VAPADVTSATGPTIKLDAGTFTGSSSSGVDKFLGIPFALSPTGSRRFALPVANDPYNGTYSATSFGFACPQQAVTIPNLNGAVGDIVNYAVNQVFSAIYPQSEDCLTINVIKPSTATPTSKLPVLAWIFGGGFELGSPNMYDGTSLVSRSVSLGSPVIYLSMNYRVSAFGFLAGKEVKSAGIGNLGLQDQRLALKWIQKYISAFGGDPTKVTIWGESAGAISVAMQMIANNGNHEGLFRGGIMQSGSPIPVGDITNGQKYYDAIVAQTGCSKASDTLSCLRTVPYSTLKKAVDASPSIFSYESLRLAYLPRADGVFLTDTPQHLVANGAVAKVPFITGDCDDEGTLFSLSTLNITTSAQLRTWIQDNYLPKASLSEIDQLLTLYTDKISEGSPFGTGSLNAITPQFKRIAAIQGDLVFQAARRFFLDNVSSKQNTWSFLSKRGKGIPVLGALHASDLLNSYFGGELVDYFIRFTNNLDPNVGSGSGIYWPKYDTSTRLLNTFLDGFIPQTITTDTYRKDGMDYLTKLGLSYPI